MILRAKYVLDANLQPIDGGFVHVEGTRIAEVGKGKKVGHREPIDCGDVLLIPGLVNAHTHLELGGLAGAVAPTHDFTDWLRRLVPRMRTVETDQAAIEAAICSGLENSLAAGTTLLGDISRFSSATRKAISEFMPRPAVVSFGEVLGVGNVDELLHQSIDRNFESPDLICGISPHSTYTVPPETMSKCVEAGISHEMRMCIHAAESAEEEELLSDGTGPLRTFLESVGAWDSSREAMRQRPIKYLEHAKALGPRTLLAHCNYVNDTEIDLLARTQTSVAYCPRTHHAFGHPPHRFPDMLKAGINVCLGTDSLASNPSLSILDEMRFLHKERPDVSTKIILRMATTAGAKALGFENLTGALQHGMRADFAAIPLDQNGPTDPLENMLTGTSSPRFCVVAGD